MVIRRIRCEGDCGRWWFYGDRLPGKKTPGKPRRWCPDCYRAKEIERKREDRAYAREVFAAEAQP